MNDIDNALATLGPQLIKGRQVRLTKAKQASVAAWSAKTILMLQLIHRRQDRALQARQDHRARGQGDPRGRAAGDGGQYSRYASRRSTAPGMPLPCTAVMTSSARQ